jgi:hypothetical protein
MGLKFDAACYSFPVTELQLFMGVLFGHHPSSASHRTPRWDLIVLFIELPKIQMRPRSRFTSSPVALYLLALWLPYESFEMAMRLS